MIEKTSSEACYGMLWVFSGVDPTLLLPLATVIVQARGSTTQIVYRYLDPQLT
jgi:hypothetical protein